MTISRQILVVAVLFAAAIGLYVTDPSSLVSSDNDDATAGGKNGRQAFAAPVMTQPLTFNAENLRIEAVGTATALRSASLHAASSGEVIEVNIEPNALVEQGATLLRLDSRREQLARQLAEVRLRNVRQLLARYERTSGTGAVPASTIDEARNTVEEAEIELSNAIVALDDRTVKAPFTGNVSLTDIEPGDRIGTEDLVTTIDDRSALLITFQIPESYLELIDVGTVTTVRGWSGTARSIDGRIVDIDSRIDPVSRSVTARARVDNPDSWMRPGMSFAVIIELPGQMYPEIPEIALQWGGEGAYFWTIDNGVAVQNQATIIQRLPGTILVQANVEEGSKLVVEGIQRLRPGMAVNEVQDEDAVTPTSPSESAKEATAS